MNCAWSALIGILPVWMRQQVDKHKGDSLENIRIRIKKPPSLEFANGATHIDRTATHDDIQFCINMATNYSPWTASSVRFGYITSSGGHRIGICGNALPTDGCISGFSSVSSICIRVASDHPGIAKEAAHLEGSVLIIGCPGSGKTTLLRDLIRQRSEYRFHHVCVVDERSEIFPLVAGEHCFDPGNHTDVISGCSKFEGIDAVLRNMGPQTIAVDEITAQRDCEALINAGWCGVELLATAHAFSKNDLYSRPLYKPIIESGLFDHLIILKSDKSWSYERI